MIAPVAPRRAVGGKRKSLGCQASLICAVVVEADCLGEQILTGKTCENSVGTKMRLDVIGIGPKRRLGETERLDDSRYWC